MVIKKYLEFNTQLTALMTIYPKLQLTPFFKKQGYSEALTKEVNGPHFER